MYAVLSREPHGLSFAQIGRLTRPQIAEILLYPRKQDGSLDQGKAAFMDAPGEVMTLKGATFEVWRKRYPGMTTEQMEQRYAKRFGRGTRPG